MTEPFITFPKIPRLKTNNITITEKIDGTNAQVHVFYNSSGELEVRAGSRNKWITPDSDNYGFACLVELHKDELRALGPGTHYGEWWGAGIQRRYGQLTKSFSLFNTHRWKNAPGLACNPPACCRIAPTLYVGLWTPDCIEVALQKLRSEGSLAAPGFMKPEGVVIYQHVTGQYFKAFCEDDGIPKSLKNEQPSTNL